MPTERESTINYLQILVDELLPPPPNLADDDAETKALREALLLSIEALQSGFQDERDQLGRLRAAVQEAIRDVTMHPSTRDQLMAALVEKPSKPGKKTRAEKLRDRSPLDDL